MDNQQIVELLKKDMRGEHQAIVQYLWHAYHLGEGELAGGIEGIAREEMRHLDWLADLVNELGGDPAMERDPVDFGIAPAADQLTKDVGLEQTAIEQYQAHIDAIDHEEVRLTLSRILHDEKAHWGMFSEWAEGATGEGEPGECETASDEGRAPAPPPKRLAEILNIGVRHEYTVVLQYLYHSFVTEDKELSESFMNRAINEMQHMGWLSEELTERGAEPEMEHTELFLSRDAAKNLEADIAVEREVAEAYTLQLPELNDEELETLITRIRDHEIFHIAMFSEMLEELGEGGDASGCADASDAEGESPEAPAPEPKPRSIPTVGSLIGKD